MKHAQEWASQPPLQEPSEDCILPSAAAPVSKLKVAKKPGSGQAAVPNSLAYLLASPTAPSRARSSNNKRGGGAKPSVSQGSASSKIPTPLSAALTGTPYDKIPSPQQPPPPSSSVQFSPMQPTLMAPSPVSPLSAGPSPAITMTVAVDSSGVQTVQIHLPEVANGVTTMANSPTDVVELALCPPPVAGRISSTKKRRASKTERRLLPLKEREFDPEKHCGVWMSDIHRACTRSLTCKAHSLTLRRAVQGRSRSFDDLLSEHRSAKETIIKQQKDQAVAPHGPHPPTSAAITKPTPLSPTGTKAVLSQAKPRPNAGIRPSPSPPKKILLSSLLQSGCSELSVEVPSTEAPLEQLPVSGLLQRVFPTPVSLSFTPHHPKPLAVCSFGLRRASRAIPVDRKWDYLKATLRSTFQRQKVAARNSVGGVHSLLRPAVPLGQAPHHARETNIELPNGLQLSIGVQPDGHKYEIDCMNGRAFENGASIEWDPL